MFIVNFSDYRRGHSFVTDDPKSVHALYSLLINADPNKDIHAIHVYAASSGVELDPEKGLEPKNI